jgi:putative addiction module killer protein
VRDQLAKRIRSVAWPPSQLTPMFTVTRTQVFIDWLNDLKDRRAAARIAIRIERMEDGNFGDVKSVGEGVREMRIDYGPSYRAYFIQREKTIIVMLCGGDKKMQSRDIARAKALAKECKE